MQKQILSLLTVLFISTTCYAVDSTPRDFSSPNQQNNYPSQRHANDSQPLVVYGGPLRNDPHWYRSHREGEFNDPARSDQYTAYNGDTKYYQAWPKSDSGFYKSQKDQEQYGKGGSDYLSQSDQYPNSRTYPEHHQTSPKSNPPRWDKSREARREYLKGGSDYPRYREK